MVKLILNIHRWIFARKKFQIVNLALFHLGLRGLGIYNYENDTVSGDKHLTKKILPKIIKNKNPVFFDVGAHIGSYSNSLLNKFPEATIYAFEPHPKSFSCLKNNASSDRLKIYNFALGNACENLTLYDRSDLEGSDHATLHKSVISEIHKQDVVTTIVPVQTIDAFSKRENITYIDFLKIDTEGNEFAVLQGASKLLENDGIGCIYFEFNSMNIVSRVFFRDFRKMLHNYDLYRLLPNSLLLLNDAPVSTELFAFQNIVAILKKHKEVYKN